MEVSGIYISFSKLVTFEKQPKQVLLTFHTEWHKHTMATSWNPTFLERRTFLILMPLFRTVCSHYYAAYTLARWMMLKSSCCHSFTGQCLLSNSVRFRWNLIKYDVSAYLFYVRPGIAEMADCLCNQKQARLALFSQHDGTEVFTAKESGSYLQSRS